MMLRTYLFWSLLVVVSVHCFQRLRQQTGRPFAFVYHREQHPPLQMNSSKRNVFLPKIGDKVALQSRQVLEWDSPLRQIGDCTCPHEYDNVHQSDHHETEDIISDVGEAAFAMLGSLWAEEGSSIPTSLLFPGGANSNQYETWNDGEEHHIHYKDLTRTKLRAVLEGLANHPYADEANLDIISTQFLQ